MRKLMVALAGATALTAASAANAAITIGTGSTISIGGPVIVTPTNADASQGTGLDFTTSNSSNGSAPGTVTLYNGAGSFGGLFCTGTCGTINDVTSLAVGPVVGLSPFFTLTSGPGAGITYSLTNINSIDRSVAGILGFMGTGTFGGTLGGVDIIPSPGSFVFSTQGGNITTFSATATATTAVPESATWALMLLGFGGIGMALRRRRRPVLSQLA